MRISSRVRNTKLCNNGTHNDKKTARNHQALAETLKSLPSHYYDNFTDDFILLLAGLEQHGFTILRADEAANYTGGQNLWTELSHPSVWLSAPLEPGALSNLRSAKPGTPEHTEYINQTIHANLLEQQRLLILLEEFYSKRDSSFYAKLIVETVERGESYLRSQGSSMRLILEDKKVQALWLKASNAEMLAFATFLINKS